MEFILGLQWGTGLSLGFCVGLVVWMFLKVGVERLLGIPSLLDESRQFSLGTLRALLHRNRLTAETNEIGERIAAVLERKESENG